MRYAVSPTARTSAERSYREQLVLLVQSEIPFLVGGAYALDVYVGISRDTKDFDLFVLREDVPRVLDVFAAAGYRTKIIAPHWLAKVFGNDGVTDIIFNSGNGICEVDREWFEHARPCELFDLRLRLCPPEETIWQKAFLMERERYDGADVAHLIRACGASLAWGRLLERFGDHWPVLLSHLILFRYIFPNEEALVPYWVLKRLLDCARFGTTARVVSGRVCRGPLLSSRQYSIDINQWAYEDPRIPPLGHIPPEEVALWEAWLQGETSHR